MTPFEQAHKAYNDALIAGVKGEALDVFMKKFFESASSTTEVLTVWLQEDDSGLVCLKWEDIFRKAIEVAKVWQDAWMLFKFLNIHSESGIQVFDKSLLLCNSDNDVETLFKAMASDYPDPTMEEFYLKIFARWRSMPEGE